MTGQKVRLTPQLQERVLYTENLLRNAPYAVPPKLKKTDSKGLTSTVVEQLKRWVADDGRLGPDGRSLGEGLVLTPELRRVVEAYRKWPQ
jgi:hypothetical protein